MNPYEAPVNSLVMILIGAIFLVIIVIAVIYNSLVNRRNQAKYANSCIDVLLKKRYDLIPNLVETVKGYAAHERATFESVIQSRNKALSPSATWQDQQNLATATHSIFALAESYPALRSDANFLMLQRQLNECEEQISAARRAYNASVMEYQNAIDMFPSSIIANIFHFTPMASYEATEVEKENVHVRF